MIASSSVFLGPHNCHAFRCCRTTHCANSFYPAAQTALLLRSTLGASECYAQLARRFMQLRFRDSWWQSHGTGPQTASPTTDTRPVCTGKTPALVIVIILVHFCVCIQTGNRTDDLQLIRLQRQLLAVFCCRQFCRSKFTKNEFHLTSESNLLTEHR